MLVLCLALFVAAMPAHAVPGVAWSVNATGAAVDTDAQIYFKNAIAVDASGNIYVAGYRFDGIGNDFITIKYDANGAERWRTIANGVANGDDRAIALRVSASGDVYVTGYTYDGADHHFLTLKYDTNGVELWRAVAIGAPASDDFPQAMALDGAGNVYVTGYTFSAPNYHFLTVKYDSNGFELWRAIGGSAPQFNAPSAMAIDGIGNTFVTGTSTIKYDVNGVQQWEVGVGGGQIDGGQIVADASGNAYISGTFLNGVASNDWVTLKLAPDGTELWRVMAGVDLRGSGFYNNSLAIDAQGNIYMAGIGPNAGTFDFLTIKYSASGLEQWRALGNHLQPPPSFAEARAVAVDGNGNVYVTGGLYDNNEHKMDYLTIRYSASGTQTWWALGGVGDNRSDEGLAIALDNAGRVYVTGTSFASMFSPLGSDILTIGYNTRGVEKWRAREGASAVATTLTHDDPAAGKNAVAMDSIGNVYITGTAFNGLNHDFLTIKYDASGKEQWRATADGPAQRNDVPVAIALDPAGNVYVTGTTQREDMVTYDFLTIKYNGSGKEQWRTIYDTGHEAPVTSSVHDIATASDGSVYLTAFTFAAPIWPASVTVKYNAGGVEQWRSVGLALDEDDPQLSHIMVDFAGNPIVTGTASWDPNVMQARKYDPNGSTLWVFSDSNWPVASGYASSVVDAAGNVYLTGYQLNGLTADFLTIKIDAQGVEQWRASADGGAGGEDRAHAIAVDQLGNVYVTGTSSNGSSDRILTIKYDANGIELWRATASGNQDARAYAIAVDGAGNVYVTGEVDDVNGEGFLTIKYDGFGAELWRLADYAPGNYGIASWIDVGPTGGVYVAGEVDSLRFPSGIVIQKIVDLTPTVTTVASSQNPSKPGQVITLTASVSGQSPTGTVAFANGGTPIAGCNAIGLSAGSAACATAALTSGSNWITAAYSGDAANMSSVSSPLLQTVTTTPTIKLVSSLNPSRFTQGVTFTATVTGNLPTGTVDFRDGSSTICSAAPLQGASNSPTATCTTAALPMGKHQITAAYSGDANNTLVTSKNLKQKVTK